MVQSKEVPHFMDHHHIIGWRTAKVSGFHYNVVQVRAMSNRQIDITSHTTRYGPYQPDINVKGGVPPVMLFNGLVIAVIITAPHHRVRRNITRDAIAGI